MGVVEQVEDPKNLWLRHRVKDIFDDRGYSLRGFATRINMNYQQLRRLFNGEALIMPYLHKFADGFKLPVERILQTDCVFEKEQFQQLSSSTNKYDLEKALSLAELFVKYAVGCTEKSDQLCELGNIHHKLGNDERAFEAWESAYEIVQKVKDNNRLFRVVNNLIYCLFKKCEFDTIEDLIKEVEWQFSNDPEKYGRLLHYKGTIAGRKGDAKLAEETFLQCLPLYEHASNEMLIGRLYNDLAECNFHSGNLKKSEEYLLSCKNHSHFDTFEMKINCNKNLARVLICCGKLDEALRIIEESLEQSLAAPNAVTNELIAKLLLMKLDITKVPVIGESIFSLNSISREVKNNASDILVQIYAEGRDGKRVLKYYSIMKETLVNGVENYRKGRWF